MSEQQIREQIANDILRFRDAGNQGIQEQLEQIDDLVTEESIDLEIYGKYIFNLLTEVAESVRQAQSL